MFYEEIPRPSQLRKALITVKERFETFERALFPPHDLPRDLLDALGSLKTRLDGIIAAVPSDEEDLEGTSAVIGQWRQWKADAQKVRQHYRKHDDEIRFLAVVPY